MHSIFPSLFVSAVFFLTVNTAHAATLIFDLDPFTGDSADATVKVDDNTVGLFRVNVKVNPEINTSNIGDITGVFFNFSPLVMLGNIDSILGGSIIGFGNNTADLGGGVNLTGGGPNNPGLFDVGLRYDGFNIDDVQEVEFTIDRTDPDLSALLLSDFTGFGLRLQTVGPLDGEREGSSKLSGFNFTSDDPTPSVPEPSTLVLLGTSFLGFFLKRRFF